MRTTWTFHTPGKLIFGRGAARQLGEIVKPLRTGRALLVTDKQSVTGLDNRSAADRGVAAVERLKESASIPARMSDVGVQPEHLPAMAETAFAVKRVLRVNPRTVSQDDLEAILRSAL